MDNRVIAAWVFLLSAVLLLASSTAINSRDIVVLSGFAAISLAWLFVVSQQLGRSSSLAAPIWEQTSTVLNTRLKGSVAAARNQPFFSAGSQIACMLAMLSGYLISRNRHAAHLLMMSFLGSALLYATYGLIAFTFWPNYFLWHQKFNYLNALTATFINPNIAASYFGAATLGWLLIFAESGTSRSNSPPLPLREWIRSHLHAASPRKMALLLACFVLFITTMLTESRAGSVLSLLAIAGAIQTRFRRELFKSRWFWALPALTIVFIVGLISVLAPGINARFGVQGFVDSGRWHSYASTIEMIKDYPWLGFGLGTFKWVFPAYRSNQLPSYGTWEQAHNTTLEIAAEMGVPFTLLLGTCWLVVFLVLARGMLARNRDAVLPTASFWIGLLAILHSQIDFPLQIPGFSLPIFAILGMGLAQSFSSRTKPLAKVPN
jgi:O-antigen ligase